MSHRSLNIVFLFCCILLPSKCEAQSICSLIAKYFVQPPQGFIDERGEQLSTGRWRSNQSFSNSNCYIRESKSGTHSISCIINSGKNVDIVTQYGEAVERGVDGCLARIPEGSQYLKKSSTDHSFGIFSHETRWTYESSSGTYEISISANRDDDDGRMYNSMRVEWTP